MTTPEFAVVVARGIGRLEGLVHGLKAGAMSPQQIVDDIEAEAQKLGDVVELAVAPARRRRLTPTHATPDETFDHQPGGAQ